MFGREKKDILIAGPGFELHVYQIVRDLEILRRFYLLAGELGHIKLFQLGFVSSFHVR